MVLCIDTALVETRWVCAAMRTRRVAATDKPRNGLKSSTIFPPGVNATFVKLAGTQTC